MAKINLPPPPPRSSPIEDPSISGVFSQVWSGWFRRLWQVVITIANSTVNVFTQTSNGLVPAPGTTTPSTDVLTAAGTWAAPSSGGTVTRVGITSSRFNVTGSPITTSGTIDIEPEVFSSGQQGEVPASGGGTTNFLRADGSWAAPPGSGGGSGTVTDITAGDGLVTNPSGGITTTGSISLQYRFADSMLLMGA